MVSFQCDACMDVVKKPKLDQHRVRCGASFTCIDCSKTFQTPVDWKGHTSCISEAEKYQKSLYKPKMNGGGRDNSYRNGSAGKFQGRGGHWGRPPPRSQATGANGTPLGTPTRMSPVIAPPEHDEKTDTTVASRPAMEPHQPTKQKMRKSEVTNTAHVEPVNQGTDDPISRKELNAKVEKEGQKEKKEKKEKKKKDKDNKTMASDMGANGVTFSGSPEDVAGDDIGTKPKKEKKDKKDKKDKKEKKVKSESAIPQESTVDAACASSSLPSDAAGGDKSKKEKKEKKKKKIQIIESGDAPNQDSADVRIVDTEGKKKKKQKSDVANGAPDVNGEVDAPSASSEKTSKKRKREAEEQEDVTGQKVATEKKRKKKTVAVS